MQPNIGAAKRRILKALMSALSAVIAIIFCWFGFDGTRGGIAAGSTLVAFSGFGFFCYGLASIMLLLSAWATGARIVWRLSAILAAVPFILMLTASFGADGINGREAISLAEVAALLLLNVLSLRFVTNHGA